MRTTSVLGLAGALVAVLGACDVVIGIPDRKAAEHLVCTDEKCVCTAGFADCDGDPSDGCEAVLATDDRHCGACGNDCQNGSCSAGSCACKAGFVDCDQSPKNGCEARLATDAENCGACGHGCLGGMCKGGRCQPFELQVFSFPQSISLGGGFVYVGVCASPNASPLVRLPVAGGKPIDLATSVDCGIYQSTLADTIYWINATTIFASPRGQSVPPTVVVENLSVANLAASPAYIYWVTKASMTMTGEVARVPIAGGPVETLSSDLAIGIAVDALNAYWTDAKGIHFRPHVGTANFDLAGAEVPKSLEVDATTLYVMDTGLTAPGIVAIPLAGGAAKVIAPKAGTFAMKSHGGHLYWLDYQDGNVYDLAPGAATPVVLATGYGYATNAHIVADEEAVYWLSDQAVYKLAK